MALISKQRFQQLLQGAPEGVGETELRQAIEDSGDTLEGSVSASRSQRQAFEEANAGFGATAQRAGFSVTRTLGNVPRSAGRLVGDVAEAVTHPIRTVQAVGDVLAGGVEKLIPGEQGQEQTFDAIVDFYKSRYGSYDAFLKTLEDDPIGVLADASTFFTGVGGAAKGVAVVGAKAATTAGKVSRVGRVAATAGRVGRAAEAIGAATDPLMGAARAGGRVLRGASRQAHTRAARLTAETLDLNPQDIRRIARSNIAGVRPEEWLLERGYIGKRGALTPENLQDTLADAATKSRETLDAGLANITDTFDIRGPAKPVMDVLDTLDQTFKGAPGNEDLVGRVRELRKKRNLNLTEINEVKRMVDSELDVFTRSGDVRAGAQGRGLANLRDRIKVFIEKEASQRGFEDVRGLNKDTQVLTEIELAMEKVASRKIKRSSFSLSDLVASGVGGTVWGGSGAVIALIGKKLILENPRLRLMAARAIESLPEASQNILNQALKAGKLEGKAAQIGETVLRSLTGTRLFQELLERQVPPEEFEQFQLEFPAEDEFQDETEQGGFVGTPGEIEDEEPAAPPITRAPKTTPKKEERSFAAALGNNRRPARSGFAQSISQFRG